MSRRHLWVSAAIIAVIVFIAFALSVPHTRDVLMREQAAATSSVPVVAVHDAYKKGMHTISGSILVPDACIPASASVTLSGDASSTQSILIAVTTEDDGGICLQVPTSDTFQMTLAAPANLPIQATVNGVSASTTSL
jgi:hypothetical protein